jgi:flagellin-specific chaperone FliS
MNKFIAKIFKSAGVDAKVSKSADNPRFKVVDNKLTLEGVVRSNRYTMSIKDNTGKKIDNLSVIVSNSNDIVNRINESINTLKMLSSAYDQQKLVEEDEEFDTVIADEEAPETLEDGLNTLYDSIMDVAEQAEQLTDIADSDDAEQINEIISIVSSLYDCALDVDDFLEELADDEEDMDESIRRKSRKSASTKSVVNELTVVESMLRGNKENSDILKAIKDIKSELIVRGR